MRILIDLNVVLDVLQKREPHYSASAQIFRIVESTKVEGFLAAHSLTTLFYLLRRHLNTQQAYNSLQDLNSLFSVAKVDQVAIDLALTYGWKDFEDAVQMAAAMGCEAKYLITRNQKDFSEGPLSALTPTEFAAISKPLLKSPSKAG